MGLFSLYLWSRRSEFPVWKYLYFVFWERLEARGLGNLGGEYHNLISIVVKSLRFVGNDKVDTNLTIRIVKVRLVHLIYLLPNANNGLYSRHNPVNRFPIIMFDGSLSGGSQQKLLLQHVKMSFLSEEPRECLQISSSCYLCLNLAVLLVLSPLLHHYQLECHLAEYHPCDLCPC